LKLLILIRVTETEQTAERFVFAPHQLTLLLIVFRHQIHVPIETGVF